ncbi:MAG TPA: hypothetical protein VMG10_12465 [Gemmataceae bacterium]|nr:hypothetical protein [Gemmataceae bacterium]
MKSFLSLLSISLLFLVWTGAASAVEKKKDNKNPLPGHASWELKPLQSLFRVVTTEYDGEGRKIKWTVETRDGYRTADFIRDITRRPFTFRFLDDGGNELALIQLAKSDFGGLPRERIMKPRTRLTITLDVPRVIPKTKKVVLQRGGLN